MDDYSQWLDPVDYGFSGGSLSPYDYSYDSFGSGSFYEPSFDTSYFDFSFDPTDYSFGSNDLDFFSANFDPVSGTYSPLEDYSFAGADLGFGSPLLGTKENLGLMGVVQENQNREGGILSGIMDSAKGVWDKAGDFINGKNNMSTLLALATLASMGQKPKGPVNAAGPAPSSVKATEIYNKFTPEQQANMQAFASKKNLVPLAQQFDPRTYGYGGEVKFFDREA